MANQPASLWHDVDLYAKSWLDEHIGLHYISKMSLGTIRQFEVQLSEPFNVIQENLDGSAKLASFGMPIPFTYGCFPQTYRDPSKKDELYRLPGSDDPLDVIDLSSASVPVGSVVCCRPLGAVCLIDDGKADWKILVVGTESDMCEVRSLQDVERLAPGRIEACWKWMKDYKRSCGKDSVPHLQIHDAQHALKRVAEDHMSWKDLLAEVGPTGFTRGHWVRAAVALPVQLPRRKDTTEQIPLLSRLSLVKS